MKHIPIFPKIVLNILLYIFYVLVISLGFSFVFPQVLTLLEKPIPHPDDPIFYKTQVLILVCVLITTMIFRRYLYIWVCNGWSSRREENEGISKPKIKETLKQEKGEEENPLKKIEKAFDDEMKIYIDKEIK
jgi:hypothetical protein